MPRYGRGRDTSEVTRESTGFEQWGGYVESRRLKYQQQFACNSENTSLLIFTGVTIYINGYTDPSSDILRDMVTSRGGNYEHWLMRRRVTHVIASNLNHSKINSIRSLKVVSPKWITDSVEQGKLLCHTPYLLYNQTSAMGWLKNTTSSHTIPSGPHDVTSGPDTAVREGSGSENSEGYGMGATGSNTDDEPCVNVDGASREKDDVSRGMESGSDRGGTRDMTCPLDVDFTGAGYVGTCYGNVEQDMSDCDGDSGDDDDFMQVLFGSQTTSHPTEFSVECSAKTSLNDEQNRSDVGTSNNLKGDIGEESVKLREHATCNSRGIDDAQLSEKTAYFEHTLSECSSKSPRDSSYETYNSASGINRDRTSIGTSSSSNKVSHTSESKTSSTTSEPHSTSLSNTNNPNFISDFYNQSRLHHLSTWKTEFTAFVKTLQQQNDGNFPGRLKLQKWVGCEENSELSSIGERLIMHIDMDCYFVSVAVRDRPDLVGKPIAVTHSKGRGPRSRDSGSNLESQTGRRHGNGTEMSLSEIASCSYQARQAGLTNGMMMGTAKNLCPGLITMPYEFDKYRSISQQLYNIVASYTHDIEAGSCDELLVDLTELLTDVRVSPLVFASLLRSDIQEATRCPASAGIGPNILVAKLATRRAKPNGQYHVKKAAVEEFMSGQNLTDLPGVGRAMRTKLHALPAHTCADLRVFSLPHLQGVLGNKHGETLYMQCRGLDDREVVGDRVRKSVSADINYGIRFKKLSDAQKFMGDLCSEVSRRLRKVQVKGRVITLKLMIRRDDAPQEAPKFMGHGKCNNMSKSVTLPTATDDPIAICNECMHLLQLMCREMSDLRGVGIQVTKLESELTSRHVIKSRNQSILGFVAKRPRDIQEETTAYLNSSKINISSDETNHASPLPTLSRLPLSSLPDLTQFPPLECITESTNEMTPSNFDHVQQSRFSSPSKAGIKVTKLESELESREVMTSRNQSLLGLVAKRSTEGHEETGSDTSVIPIPKPVDEINHDPPLPSLSRLPLSSLPDLPKFPPPEHTAESTNEMTSPNSDRVQQFLCFPSPSQIDPSVLSELPAAIRNEVNKSLKYVQQQKQRSHLPDSKLSPSKSRSLRDMLHVAHSDDPPAPQDHHSPVTALPSPSQICVNANDQEQFDKVIHTLGYGCITMTSCRCRDSVDMSCFDALPAELQEELRREYRRQHNCDPSDAATIPAQVKRTQVTVSPHKQASPKLFKVPSADNVARRKKRSPKKLDFHKQPTLKRVVERGNKNEFCVSKLAVPDAISDTSDTDIRYIQEDLPADPHANTSPADCEHDTCMHSDPTVSEIEGWSVAEVKVVLSRAIAHGDRASEENITDLQHYISHLISQKNLEAVFLLFKYLHRRIVKAGHTIGHWRRDYNILVDFCQTTMRGQYGMRLRCEVFR